MNTFHDLVFIECIGNDWEEVILDTFFSEDSAISAACSIASTLGLIKMDGNQWVKNNAVTKRKTILTITKVVY